MRKLKKNSKKSGFSDEHTSHKVPKKIWIYWGQGWQQAPRLVQLCKDSWYLNNKGWEVIELDDNNISKYINFSEEIENKNIPHVWKADLLRLYLLEQHGGVWVDATVFCTTPLDSWIAKAVPEGFFAFNKPKTTLASWFLVSEKNNPIFKKWKVYANRYWKFTDEGRRYWVFYTFEFMVFLNRGLRRLWRNTPKIDSKGSYVVQNILKEDGKSDRQASDLLNEETAFVHKLNWKTKISKEFLGDMERKISDLTIAS